MKLQLRPKSKREQALDAFASVAKTWSEWHLGKKVTTTAAKGARKASKAKGVAKSTPLKIAGAVTVVGGIGAAVAKKLMGGKAEPIYTPPGPAPDMAAPPPSPVVVEDLAKDPSAGETTPVEPTPEPAITASTDIPPQDPTPVAVGDLASDATAAAEAEPEVADEPEAEAEAEVAADAEPAAAAEPEPEAAPEAEAEPEAAAEPEPEAAPEAEAEPEAAAEPAAEPETASDAADASEPDAEAAEDDDSADEIRRR